MKLYELRVAALGIMRLRETYYFTSRTDAMKLFRRRKKDSMVVDVYQVTVNTNLKAPDWCELLQSDAVGTYCTVTPQNLITERVLIATFEKEQAAA